MGWVVCMVAFVAALSACRTSEDFAIETVGSIAFIVTAGIVIVLFLLRRSRRKSEEYLEALVKRATAAREVKNRADQAREMMLAKISAAVQNKKNEAGDAKKSDAAPAAPASPANGGTSDATPPCSTPQQTDSGRPPVRPPALFSSSESRSWVQVDPDLHGSSIDLHRNRLRRHLDGLRMRAFWSFLPGALLCLLSLLGPFESYLLCSRYDGRWEFMLGGSALAAVLLAAGSALLRHDHKIRALVEASQSELRYFERIKAGMDLAASQGAETYENTLRAITQQLIGKPPVLGEVRATPTPPGDAGDAADEGAAAGLTSSVIAKLIADLVKETSKNSSTKKD